MNTATLPKGTTDAVLRNLFPKADPYAADPGAWAADILDVHLWSKQRETAESVRDNPRTAVKAGRGVGKTFVAAVILLWFLDTHPESRVITTATKWSQVKHLLWHEVNQLHARARNRPQAKGRPVFQVEPLQTELHLPDGRYALGLSSKPENSETFAGHHAPNILVIYDEASGIHSRIFEVGEGYMTTDGARALLIGNPTRRHGAFFDTFNEDRHLYGRITISALESPAITGETVPDAARRALTGSDWVESRKQGWGEESGAYAVHVRGEFPDADEELLISPELVELAQNRDLSGDAIADPGNYGWDIGEFGDDLTVGYRNRAGMVREVYVARKQDTMATTGAIVAEVAGHTDRASVVDKIGVGSGVWSRLLELGIRVVGFGAGERAIDPRRFVNRRAEAWWALRCAMEDDLVDIDPDDEDLAYELQAPKWGRDSRGRVWIESKSDMKARGVASPNRADAVVMSFVRTDTVLFGDPVQEGRRVDDTHASGGNLLTEPM